jgi:hypothetical protein
MSRSFTGRWLKLARLLTGLLLLVAAAPSASAGTLTLAAFSNCPVANPVMVEHEGGLCIYARSNSTSTLGLGDTVVPLTRPIVLQGGSWIPAEGASTSGFVAPTAVPTIMPLPQPIPGGLPKVIDPLLLSGATLERYDRLVRLGITRVTATVELAAPAKAITFSFLGLLRQEGVALRLPLKVHLRDPTGFLGPSCYIGSDAAPVVVELTDGATSPPPPFQSISGKLGQPNESKAEVDTLSENTLVDNAFALPAAQTCGASFSGVSELDVALDLGLALPSVPGMSAVVLDSTFGAAAGPHVAVVDHLSPAG